MIEIHLKQSTPPRGSGTDPELLHNWKPHYVVTKTVNTFNPTLHKRLTHEELCLVIGSFDQNTYLEGDPVYEDQVKFIVT